jgi:Zn finger protein HypA/HybF involved in hydrogenase expression
LRSIDPQAFQWAWDSVVRARCPRGATLAFHELPWRMRCPECGAEWDSPHCDHVCSCGCDRAYPVGGNELTLDWLEIHEPSLSQYPRGAS